MAVPRKGRFRRPSPWALRVGLAIGHPAPFERDVQPDDPAALAEVVAVVGRIRPHLAGCPGTLVGAILAELSATWLAGYVVAGDPERTQSLRKELLDGYVEVIRELLTAIIADAEVGIE